MDVAMTSMILSQNQALTSVGTAVLSMSLETIEAAGDNMIKMMEQSVHPDLGQNIDIKL